MAEKSVKMTFRDHSVKKKVVYNVENYLNMKFQSIKHGCRGLFRVNRKVVDNDKNYLNMKF